MNLFHIQRLKNLPRELQVNFHFSIAANILMTVEMTVFALIQFTTIEPWMIPLIGVFGSMSMLLVDRLSDLPLLTIWKWLTWVHCLKAISWILVLVVGTNYIWLVLVLDMCDTMLWKAESNNTKSVISITWPNHFKESSRLKVHNLVVPVMIAGGATSIALAISQDAAILLVLTLYVPYQIALHRYTKALKVASLAWEATENNTKR